MDRRRFEQLWQSCGHGLGSGDVAARFDELSERYREPHRRYHTPEHIEHCLQQFDAARAHMEQPDAVELAVWYHDVVYDIGAEDNEAQSAEFFVRHAGDHIDETLVTTVNELIMVTMHLCWSPATTDQAYLVDIDLSSFGLPWDRFLRDSVAVREEFPNTPDEQFYAKQEKFLSALLARENFCFTEFFRRRHEAQARSNITAYLQTLHDQGLL